MITYLRGVGMVYGCMYVHVWVSSHGCVHKCVEARRYFPPPFSPPYSFRQDISLNLELTNRLAEPHRPRYHCLSKSSQANLRDPAITALASLLRPSPFLNVLISFFLCYLLFFIPSLVATGITSQIKLSAPKASPQGSLLEEPKQVSLLVPLSF